MSITTCTPQENTQTGYIVAATEDIGAVQDGGLDVHNDALPHCGQITATLDPGQTEKLDCSFIIPARYVFVYLPRVDKLKINHVSVYVSNIRKYSYL